ncbi:MAG: dihydrolipoyl dehydrogenase [Candidatus Omnitrophica bacterium]|nr:dihydrolipoyl dehydrogenase [Candidatus Omnitrophota bacterium]
MKSYDLVIIGSGPGGYAAALYASRLKLKVCVIEKDLLGGACLNRGCIPTKAMLHSASILSIIKRSKEYGIEVSGVSANFPAIVARKDLIVTRLRTGIETLFRANKIELVKGTAKIKSADTVAVNGEDISAKHIIIAAGSRPMPIPDVTLDEVDACSSDGILDLKEIPKNITIVGGGVIGCEFAGLFNALGSKVTIVELLDRILATQSKEVSRKMETLFKKRGIEVCTSTKFKLSADSSLRGTARRSRSRTEAISLKAGLLRPFGPRNDEVFGSQKILVAVGRRPNTEGIGLEALGIKTEKGVIVVDDNLRTSVKNIYAIGDCVAGPLLAHKASYDGMVACDNIMGSARSADYSNVPNCIWTDPEIASIGLNEEEARSKYPDLRIAKFPYLASGKACIMGKSEGFIKMIGDPNGNILGVEIFGEGACDLIGEACLARSTGVNIKDWAHVIHGHPTLSEIFQEAAHIFTGTATHSL